MSWKRALIIGGIVLMAVTFGLADNQSDKDWNDLMQDSQYSLDMRPTAATLVKLAYFVDLWHDATLKGNGDLILQHEQELMAIIKADLGRSYQYLDACEEELARSRGERSRHSLGTDDVYTKCIEVSDDRTDLMKAHSLIKAKQRIAGALSRSTAFSNKLRLFDDYQELLRRELDLERPKLAEDISDTDTDLPGE